MELVLLTLAFLGTVAQIHQAIAGSEHLLRELRDVLYDTNNLLRQIRDKQ